MSASDARAFLARHGLAPHRDRGQNFLCDERLAEKLVGLAGVAADETVFEVGTGLGILTRALAARARRVVSVEIDAGLVRALREERCLPANVELIHADARALDWEALLGEASGPARVAANLPYSVATPLLRRLLDLGPRLRGWGVMMQRELAQRLQAREGSPDYGSFAVLHHLAASAEKSLHVHPRCFHPVPQVTSTFVRFAPRPDAPSPTELLAIEQLSRAGFRHRRKTLANSLRQAAGIDPARAIEALAALGFSERARAEDLPPAAWRALAARLAEAGAVRT